MNRKAIQVKGISKRYRLGELHKQTDSFRERLTYFIKRTGESSKQNSIWALKNVSFEIHRGETIGIIGQNGAGKSTLLKILSRITKPTTGKALINGRTGSLLEVGTGFHPELTGRENIYLNGAILGMYKKDIRKKFDEIVAFAEVEKFIDTPVKRYSSGMYTRLAFAIAANLEPEILIVDEVLSVGDLAFQKKCLCKMDDAAGNGRTILFVSHNLTAVRNLCTKTLLLENGQITDFGLTAEVTEAYIRRGQSTDTFKTWNNIMTAPGNDEVRLHSISVHPKNGLPGDPIDITSEILVGIKYWNKKKDNYLNLSVTITTEDNIIAFITTPITEKKWHGKPFPTGMFSSEFTIPGNLLNNGRYNISIIFVKNQQRWIFRQQNIVSFDIQETLQRKGSFHGKRLGVFRPSLRWKTELLEAYTE